MTDVASPHIRGPRLKRIVVGRPMANNEYEETLLPKWLALPIFASDPLSSVAYATEAALVVLVGASAGAAHLAFPLSLGIAALLAIVVVSYRQTVRVYQTSGGAYIVAKENLGRLPSLVAAAALLTDYILTVAVSVAAGVLALTSAATSLRGHELTLSIGFVLLIAVANLRGVREAGILFAIPTYAFVTSIFALIIVGFGRCATGSCPTAVAPHPVTAGVGAVTDVRRPARVRVGLDRAHGRRGDRERGQRIPSAARRERGEDTPDPRRDRDCDVRRCLLAGRAHACPPDRDRDAVGAVGDRTRSLPGFVRAGVHVLGDPGVDARSTRARCQHLVSGLPAAGRTACPRPVLRPSIQQPRRPARLLERHPHSDGRSHARCSGSTTRVSTR